MLIPDFYDRIGQKLRAWVPPPPPIKKRDPIERTEDPAKRQLRLVVEIAGKKVSSHDEFWRKRIFDSQDDVELSTRSEVSSFRSALRRLIITCF